MSAPTEIVTTFISIGSKRVYKEITWMELSNPHIQKI